MSIVALAVIKLSLVALFGFFLYKKSIIQEGILRFLTLFVINFTVPFLIFSYLVESSTIVLAHSLWIFIFLSAAIFLGGYFLGLLASFKEREFKKESVSLVSFQNAGYLPMNIAFFLFAPQVREKFLVYVFLYLLGFNVIMWSLGSFFIFKRKGQRFRLKEIFTPPITSTLIALLLIYARLARFIPSVIIEPVKMIGELSFVLSMVVLGCWLAKVNLKGFSGKLWLFARVNILKLLILPLVCFTAVMHFKVFSLLGVFIVLEAAMPSAVSLPIIAHLRKADSEFISQGVFLSHLLGIITIPGWLYLLEAAGLPV